MAVERKREEKSNAKAQSRREEHEKDAPPWQGCRGMGILPMSVHPAFRGTSAEMPRGRFVRSEPRAIIVPSEHTVTGAGQKGKRNSPEARQPPVGLSCASIEDG